MTKYDNSGALFTNDRKEKDTHPNYNGSITVDGKEYWLSGWTKSGQRGEFISVSVKPKDEKTATTGQSKASKAQNPATFDDDLDDSVPF